MPLVDIKTALFTRLESLAGLPPIYYPNTEADTPPGEHIIPFVLPADTSPVDLVSTDRETGVFQVSIYVEKGRGQIRSAEIAQTIFNGFERNLNLGDVRIERSGSAAGSFFEGKWEITPIRITYLNFC